MSEIVSVPSFGDSFFIVVGRFLQELNLPVSVPSFGDSFFIIELTENQ